MPSRAQRERSDRFRALRVLAGAPEGVTEALMLAHGFRVELLVDLCIQSPTCQSPSAIKLLPLRIDYYPAREDVVADNSVAA